MEDLKHLDFKFKGETFRIEFPNIGTYRKIEVLKQALSNGMYGQMERSQIASSNHALDMIDLEANLSVLAPELIKKIEGVDSIAELSLVHFNELKQAYMEQFVPYWEKIMKTISDPTA